ncbi:beta-propeller domain-containing protein [Candidatus Woesearchaeota archaeon]|nr:beta-propeller domain-containing protein [Candidatus Woesearchaeota archaeon]
MKTTSGSKGTFFSSMFLVLLAVLLLGTAGCVVNRDPSPTTPPNGSVIRFDDGSNATLSGLNTFTTTEELRSYLTTSRNYAYSSGRGFGSYVKEMAGVATADMAMDAEQAAPSPGDNGATDYSQTNVQVLGVDEADFVKNDDQYLYMVSGQRLLIADLYPAEEAEMLSTTLFDSQPRALFVNKDRLVLFTEDDEEIYRIAQYDYFPSPQWIVKTHALVYDISNRSAPELVEDYSIKGNFYDGRMIGDQVYFIVREYLYSPEMVAMPVVYRGAAAMKRPLVYYFENPEQEYTLHTIASFTMDKEESLDAQSFLLGYSSTLYVSQDNIYLAYEKTLPYAYAETEQQKRFYEVVVPLFPEDVQQQITTIRDAEPETNETSTASWDEISNVLDAMYQNMTEQEKEELLTKIEDAITEYEITQEQERRKTIVHKIGIDDGIITYKGQGEIKGSLLNQFSLDESGGYLRVATTTYAYTNRGSTMENNVYVLDENLDVVGELEELAPDERIYAARFIGSRLYLVTFKRIDPLFVIDLSSPTKPKVLGELKIPGYSDYLHPYDENHVIGIGKETEGNEWGGVSVKGVKVALFDVSDVTHPEQIDSEEIGDSGTDSEALHDHKAFLFSKEKNLLVLPITEVTERSENSRFGWRQKLWQGSYVFHVDEEGIEVKAKVPHGTQQSSYWYYYGSSDTVRRSLYLDNVLYTISSSKVVMTSLDNYSNLGTLELPYEREEYPVMYD